MKQVEGRICQEEWGYRGFKRHRKFPNGPDFGFDGVKSTEMDNTVGDDRKSSKHNRRK